MMNGYDQIAQALIATVLAPQRVEVDEMTRSPQRQALDLAQGLEASGMSFGGGGGIDFNAIIEAFK